MAFFDLDDVWTSFCWLCVAFFRAFFLSLLLPSWSLRSRCVESSPFLAHRLRFLLVLLTSFFAHPPPFRAGSGGPPETGWSRLCFLSVHSSKRCTAVLTFFLPCLVRRGLLDSGDRRDKKIDVWDSVWAMCSPGSPFPARNGWQMASPQDGIKLHRDFATCPVHRYAAVAMQFALTRSAALNLLRVGCGFVSCIISLKTNEQKTRDTHGYAL